MKLNESDYEILAWVIKALSQKFAYSFVHLGRTTDPHSRHFLFDHLLAKQTLEVTRCKD
jgi:hypothetical protein